MAGRKLNADEAALWEKVAATVRQMDRKSAAPPSLPAPGRAVSVSPIVEPAAARRAVRQATPGEHLDGGWDRRLRRGVVQPERSIDLHGHSLASAHAVLDRALERAVADQLRTLLIVTGKPPRDPVPHRRGLIRAAIGDWLATSRHAGRIAAIRNAHPRHGGAGALYVILRRVRTG